jgi:ribosomal-protein-alanine N-acetyltransferase
MSTTRRALDRQLEDFLISRMTEHDLLDVVEIEEKSGLSRWGWAAYYAELQNANRKFMLVARPKAPAEAGVVAYIAARLVAGELHINNVAVLDGFRRRGIGTVLINRIIAEARKAGGSVAFLEVRAGNQAAQALYGKSGFHMVARRRNYYAAPPEDALVMSLTL